MKVIGISGPSGSGKTTLIERLIPTLTQRGLSVSALKHAHQGFDIDRPGKDSFRFRAAGAAQVMIASAERWRTPSALPSPHTSAGKMALCRSSIKSHTAWPTR